MTEIFIDFQTGIPYNILDRTSIGGDSMSVEEMRQAIARAYPKSRSWQSKVSRMAENQVIAIFLSFKSRGLLV